MANNNRNIHKRGHQVVEKLPKSPTDNASYWINSPNTKREYTHPLFKFPGKFHTPIVRWAIDAYYETGKILDPFAGSGTVQVEALAKGISSFGIDVDPLSTFISQVKSTPIEPRQLKKEFLLLKNALSASKKLHKMEESIPGGDIDQVSYELQSHGLSIPPIPNIAHWFRLYVIVDLARILCAIGSTNMREKSRKFFKACLVAIIRRVSNAEPDTVSGLEVTKIQANKNKTRKISVFKSFYQKVESEILNMEDLWMAYKKSETATSATIYCGDASTILKSQKSQFRDVSLVITSPPYCRAIEYSRRHYLEMYWLGLVDSRDTHLSLAHSFIGRRAVNKYVWNEDIEFKVSALNRTIKRIERVDSSRARSVRHYFRSMQIFLNQLSDVLPENATVICILGNSVSSGIRINTAGFIAGIATEFFILKKQFSYALQHHHMQHGLWNGPGIKKEYVLVMQKKKTKNNRTK